MRPGFSQSTAAANLLRRLRVDLKPILSTLGKDVSGFEQFVHDAGAAVNNHLAEYVPLADLVEDRPELLADFAASARELETAFSKLDDGAKEQLVMARMVELRTGGAEPDAALMQAELMLSELADLIAFARDASRAAEHATKNLATSFSPIDLLVRDLAESYAAAFQIRPSWSTGSIFDRVANAVLAAAGLSEQVAKTRLQRIIESIQFGPQIQEPGPGRHAAIK